MHTKKRNVLLAAQHLFIEKGFRSTSVRDIIDEAKISKGTFYNYFSSKNDCIVAIIENAREETLIKRRALDNPQNASDVNVLIEQLSVRMNIYQEQKLLHLFASIIHSQDIELRDLIKKNYFEEISWLSKRIVDIYGEQTKNVSTDCAVLALGMIQHLQHPWIKQGAKISFEQLIRFVMRRIEAIIYDMTETNDCLLNKSLFDLNKVDEIKSKKQVIEQLENFYLEEKEKMEQNVKQAIEYIAEELSREQPRLFLIEKIVPTITEAFNGTSLEQKSISLVYDLWQLLDKLGADYK
ncbi:TetR/AcrR family transcriptional regulator [Psychrobacillus sp. FJAT-51614]|uniref:TetR/AcrR family transcriptional regulator n=1 Tax=Psychrobacillus mangrovi TaxID=3117745 RepID=A0ABU8EZV7_9BACI